MQRLTIPPRQNCQAVVESQGMHFHTIDGVPYWDESVYYHFDAGEIDIIEEATYELDRMCLEAVEHVICQRLFPQFCIPPFVVDFVLQSWQNDEHTIYGRYDLAYDGNSSPKMLEFNADTPTSLLEASAIQWFWMKDRQPQLAGNLDQFNSIHERLIEAWRSYKPLVKGPMYFSALKGVVEDYMTANYLRDTAIQAGLETQYVHISDIGWNSARRYFVCNEAPMRNLFKLYPWEWLVREEFGQYLPIGQTRWLEPPWKMILSNKAILPVLHRLFPDSPYLLRAEFEPFGAAFVKKPILSREGACISIVVDGETIAETDGFAFYRDSPCVYQAYNPLPNFDGHFPVLGSWLVNGYACGLGIREDTRLITQNTSRFVPHLFTR
jgi:glutathionylspermidine synthase